jgi:hypothetical protein
MISVSDLSKRRIAWLAIDGGRRLQLAAGRQFDFLNAIVHLVFSGLELSPRRARPQQKKSP